MNNIQNVYQTLLHRISMIQNLLENGDQFRYLLPEMLVKTIRDSYRLYHDGLAHLSAVEIFKQFQIALSESEASLLLEIETTLRKSDEYEALSQNFSLESIKSISIKLYDYLMSHKV